jgi:hypothetical protein
MAHQTYFKHQMPLASDERRQRRLAREQRLEDAYAAVDARDKGVSWITGRVTVKGAPDARNRRERHHLLGRRVMPEWKYDPDHIITVTAEEHALITNGKLDVEGDDATKPIFFHWNCAPKYRPFEILPVRLRKQARGTGRDRGGRGLTLDQQCKFAKLPIPACEYRFHPTRKWRLDYAFPVQKLAVEVEGGVFIQGRHSRGAGMVKDMEKYNTLAVGGWRLLRVTPKQVTDGTALNLVEQALQVQA